MKSAKIKNRRGFTLVELAMVMGIIGVIMGAIWWASSNAQEMQRENNAGSELQTVSQNIVGLMQGQSFGTLGNITSNMITAQTISSSYINLQNNATADNPWSLGSGGANKGFIVTALTARTFRISLYQVSRQGCLALLLQGTSCQSGQSGCPTTVYTDLATQACTPTNCAGVIPATNIGWQVMGATTANTLCSSNSYTGGNNSVDFDFSL